MIKMVLYKMVFQRYKKTEMINCTLAFLKWQCTTIVVRQ